MSTFKPSEEDFIIASAVLKWVLVLIHLHVQLHVLTDVYYTELQLNDVFLFFFSFSFAAAFASSNSWEPWKFRFSREMLQVTYSSLRLMGNFYLTSSTFFCLSTKACEIVISKIYFVRPPQKNSCFQITTKKHYKHYWSAWHAKQTNKNFPFWLCNNVPYKISL